MVLTLLNETKVILRIIEKIDIPLSSRLLTDTAS